MGGGKGQQVEQVDMDELIRTQAEVNRYDLDSPFGRTRWGRGANGEWSRTDQLSPENQALYDARNDYLAQGPVQHRPQPLPPWLGAMGRQHLQRVSNRFGYDIPHQGALKPRQQNYPGVEPMDLEAIRQAGYQDNPGGVPGAGGFGGPGGPQFGGHGGTRGQTFHPR